MQKVRPAVKKDAEDITKILKELDLYYTGLQLKDFWVAEQNGQIVGTAQLEVLPDLCFLSSVGVRPTEQKHGIGKALLTELFNQCKGDKPVYLYTIIPGFFAKFGFKPTTDLPPQLPSKSRYECAACHSDRCVTMVRPSQRRAKHAA
ncbi:GNAT family N-acetyltransferase [Candidatus Margulisiibacteriota bacterium]